MPVTTFPLLSRRGFAITLAGAGAAILRAQDGAEHWALLSDTHIPADPDNGHRGFRPTDNLAKVVPQVVEAAPEAALICGDVARLKGEAADYEVLKRMMAPIIAKVPVAMALGNHDNRTNFLAALGESQKGAQAVNRKHVLAVEGRTTRMIVLDSLIEPDFTPGLLGVQQRGWLQKYLAAARPMPTVICVHHTLDDGDGSLLDAPRLFDILKPHRHVKAVLYGHSHRYAYDVWEGIHLVNLPAVGYNFTDQQPVGWVDARFSAAGAALTLRSFGGNESQNGKTVELKWRS